MSALSGNCCASMKPPPSSSSSSSSHRRATLVTWLQQPRNEELWRSHCLVGIACMVITLQDGHLSDQTAATVVVNINGVAESKGNVQWSNQRQCEAWRVNSLETVVPENLPRPSARRRYDKVLLDHHTRHTVNAPPVKSLTLVGSKKCFTL